MSPTSIRSLLSLTMFGAEDETQSSMLSGLRYPSSFTTSNVAEGFKIFSDIVKKTQSLRIGKMIQTHKETKNSVLLTFYFFSYKNFRFQKLYDQKVVQRFGRSKFQF